jgi:hypothetical protein
MLAPTPGQEGGFAAQVRNHEVLDCPPAGQRSAPPRPAVGGYGGANSGPATGAERAADAAG